MFHVKQSPGHEGDVVASYLAAYAHRHSLDIALDRLDLLADLLSWLAPASYQLGLTKYADPLQLAEQLAAPALTVLIPDVLPHVSSPVLDFGCGCGAVGLSLATAMPDLEVVLADRRKRVVQFLDIAITRYSLSNCRSLLVDLASQRSCPANEFGTVLIRAFGPVSQALDDAYGWLRPAGTAALWHQPGACRPPDGLTALRTVSTELPSLVLTIYKCV